MTIPFPHLGVCPRCSLPLVDAATPGWVECPMCSFMRQLPSAPPAPNPAAGSASVRVVRSNAANVYVACPTCGWVTDPITAQSQAPKGCWGECPNCGHVWKASPLPASQPAFNTAAAAVSYCPRCGMPSASATCPHCGAPHSLTLAKHSTAGTPIKIAATSDGTQPLNRRDSAVQAFAPDVRAALDDVLGPQGSLFPTPSRALDGMQATFSELFTRLDGARLDDYPRDEATLTLGGEIVARLAAWGIVLMAALYERSGLASDDGEGAR